MNGHLIGAVASSNSGRVTAFKGPAWPSHNSGIRIFIVPVQVYKEMFVTVHSKKYNKQYTNISTRQHALPNCHKTLK